MSTLLILLIITFVSLDFLFVLILSLRALHFVMSGTDPARAIPYSTRLLKRADRNAKSEDKMSTLG